MTVTVTDSGPEGHATWLISLRPTRPDWPADLTEHEASTVSAHFRHLLALTEKGQCVLAGPCLDAQLGVGVFDRISLPEAVAYLTIDPMVVAGYFTAEVRAMRLSMERTNP